MKTKQKKGIEYRKFGKKSFIASGKPFKKEIICHFHRKDSKKM